LRWIETEARLLTLTPAVARNPPRQRNMLFLSEEEAFEWLDLTLKRILGNAATYLKRMDVTLTIKGVTYELLSDPKFIEVAEEHLPKTTQLHEKFDTAKAVSEEPREEEPPF